MNDTWLRLTERFRSRPLRCVRTASDIRLRLRLRLASILSPSNGMGQAVKRPLPFGPNGGAMPTEDPVRGTWNVEQSHRARPLCSFIIATPYT